MPVPISTANVLGGTSFSHAGRASHNQIFRAFGDLFFKGVVEFDVLSLVGLEVVYRRVKVGSELVFLWLQTVCEQAEGSGFVLEDEELLSFDGVVSEKYLLSVDVSEHNDDQGTDKLHIVCRWQVLLLPDLLYLVDAQE